jgi:exopolysaccharide biosynthesis polyprenyl glycosylphosphotransferase
MPDLIAARSEALVPRLQAELDSVGAQARSAPAARLVARGYRRRDWYLRRLLALSDVVCVAAAMGLAIVLSGASAEALWDEYLPWALATLPAWVLLFKMYGLYERDAKRLSHSTLDDLPALFHALLLGCLLTWCYFAALAPAKLTSRALIVFGAVALVLVPAGRAVARALFVRLISPERVLLIGTGYAAGALIEKMRANRRLRLKPIGMLSYDATGTPGLDLRRLGRLEDVHLSSVLAKHRVGRVVVADAEFEREHLLGVLRDCKRASVKVSLLPVTFSALGPSVEIDDVQGVTVLGINPPVLSKSDRLVKRALDLVGAGLLGALALPVMMLLAAAIKLDAPGPVLFRQERIGRDGRRFRLLKLRTMVRDAEARRGELLARSKDPGWLHLEHDPRITRIGRLLRLASLDELPQLWNVLRGDMSLVGPRPLVAAEDEMVDDWARGRLDLTPGITGLWQVLGRTSIPFEEMVKLDYLYVTNWSLWGDIRLILRTLPVVLRRSGAN